MKHILKGLLLLAGIAGKAQKIDSSLTCRWPNSNPDTLKWPLSYGSYDTSRIHIEEGELWIIDSVTHRVTIETSGYRVTERYVPPPGINGLTLYVFREYLDEHKRPFPKSAVVRTGRQIGDSQKHW
jgi:hypothetical protein